MPRVKPNVLEPNALADLWRHTLGRIPTLCGQLVYLSSLRDPNSGAYRHHGLAAAFGRDQSAMALRQSHERAFAEWLGLPMKMKAEDVRNYLKNLEEAGAEVAQHWLRSGQSRNLVPASSSGAQREHFERDMETLLDVFRNDPDLFRRSPESTQSP